ncbi:glycosyltransferase family 2 protein [Sphingomonas nostoxanthinifaciens]|uniref:glycosyltransferase family 2 protein n=1 Tax=Sphingomonas nostoxanthinifaciens TaxID=2872652 RepID=UPI001CC20739|nr:glycosyltransferase [Sphingomonas nostoxanthinifaciens]UAK25703.1 glycosyltransferase [Sphingomonas nostoxanthinifaciens]
MGVSALTIVRNRSAHLLQLVEGLRRSAQQPDELIIVDMSDVPVEVDPALFPIRIDRFECEGLPLAAARNRAASLARFENLIFFDVDCIPLGNCIGNLVAALAHHDALLCADVRYLGPADARGHWTEAELLALGSHHPVRLFPETGIREEANPGLFWSLAFAIRRGRFSALGGFDEEFSGYGAEDTDFAFRVSRAGCKLLFVGGAIACHQYHDSYDPPVQHVMDIVRNARHFRARWDRWPMEGWLEAFVKLGLVRWRDDTLELLRLPSNSEMEAARVVPNRAEIEAP